MTKTITKWEDCGRDDLNMIPKMTAAGFEPVFSWNDKNSGRTTPASVPHDEVGFVDTRRNIRVWKKYTSKSDGVYYAWRAADLDNGSYVNARDYDSLEELIEKECPAK